MLGVALQMAGDLEAARDVMSARLALGRETGDEFVVWVESANLSMVERRLGNLDRAEGLSRQALSINAGRGDEMSIAWTLNGLAAVTAAKGDLERAATLQGLADAMLTRAGGEWPPDEREQREQTTAALAAGLPQKVLDGARAAGTDVHGNRRCVRVGRSLKPEAMRDTADDRATTTTRLDRITDAGCLA